MPNYWARLLLIVLISVATISHSSDDETLLPTVILSAPKHLEALLTKNFELPKTPLVDKSSRSFFVRRAKREIAELLSTEGYFSPAIHLNYHSQQALPVLKIKSGPQTLVDNISIEFRGELATDKNKQRDRTAQLRSAWTLKTGKPLRSSEWEAAKAALLSSVTFKDYAAAYIVKSEASVNLDSASADLTIIIDSGPAFYFGELVITGLERYHETEINISNFMPFHTGDPYRQDLLFAFQAALQNIPHFSSVLVSTTPDVAMHKAIPINILVTEKKSKQIALGAGFSSNNGLRGEINFRDYNFLTRAWNMHTFLRFEQKQQTFSAGISALPGSNNNQYSLGVRLQRTDIKNLKTINQRVSFSRSYQTANTMRQLGLIWQREEKSPSGGINRINEALALDWRWRYHVIDNPLSIRQGSVTEVRLGGSQKIISDRSFLRTYVRQQLWWPIGERDVFYFRGEIGYTLAKSRFGIPQEFLFRAGGIRSVRGLDFLSLGVREESAIVGGRTLATGTLEYTHWLLHDWGAALFMDAGDAADNWKKVSPKISYGAGVRWHSPAGPLAFDVARRLETSTLRFHFSIIVAF